MSFVPMSALVQSSKPCYHVALIHRAHRWPSIWLGGNPITIDIQGGVMKRGLYSYIKSISDIKACCIATPHSKSMTVQSTRRASHTRLRTQRDYCLFHVTWPHDIFTNKVIPNSDRSYLLNAVQEFDEKCTIQLGWPHRSCLASTDCRRTRFLKSVFCTPSVSQGPELTGLHMAQGPPKYCRVLYRCLGSREMTKSWCIYMSPPAASKSKFRVTKSVNAM